MHSQHLSTVFALSLLVSTPSLGFFSYVELNEQQPPVATQAGHAENSEQPTIVDPEVAKQAELKAAQEEYAEQLERMEKERSKLETRIWLTQYKPNDPMMNVWSDFISSHFGYLWNQSFLSEFQVKRLRKFLSLPEDQKKAALPVLGRAMAYVLPFVPNEYIFGFPVPKTAKEATALGAFYKLDATQREVLVEEVVGRRNARIHRAINLASFGTSSLLAGALGTYGLLTGNSALSSLGFTGFGYGLSKVWNTL